MYATTSTHPDIAFPVAILSQFMHNLGWIHWEAVKDVIRYLKGMADLSLMLGGSAHGLKVYVDANWASQPYRHSMSGYTDLLHSFPVAWSTRKQTIIALSTAKRSISHSLQSCVKYFICKLSLRNCMNRSFLPSPSIAITKVPSPSPQITSFTHA
jgi:hypothetical protein